MQTYGVPPDAQQWRGSGTRHMFSISPHDVRQSQQQNPPNAVSVVAAAAALASHHHQSQLQAQQPQTQHMIQSQQHQVVQQLSLSPDSAEEPSPIATRPSTNTGAYGQLTVREPIGGDEETAEDRGIGGNRWPRQETLALIKIRTEMDNSFRDSGLKAPLWEEVSRRLAELGFQRSAKKCKEKFENVHKYYKKTKGGKAGRQDGKCYRFFAQLEALYGSTNPSGAGPGAGGGNSQGEGAFLMSPRGAVTNGGNHDTSSFRLSENSDAGINLSSESSEEDYDEPDKDDKKKRKRKSWTSQMVFFESLVRKFMDKQEAMQRKFLEAIDRREQERIMKEEAWRKQELNRIHREQELRSQERSVAATRDAALVAFLQKVTGQTLQLPPQMMSSPVSRPPEFHEEPQQHEEKETFDPNSKRWPKQEVHALIRLRSGMEPRFQEPGAKGPLWEEISTSMSHMGYNRSAKRCKEKWENINKYFRKTKDNSKKRSENSKTCPYFQQLDMLYRTGVLTPPNSRSLTDQHHQLAITSAQEGARAGEEQQQEMLAIQGTQERQAGGGTSTAAQQLFSDTEKVNEKPHEASSSKLGLSLTALDGGDTFSGRTSNDKPVSLVEEMLDSAQAWQQGRTLDKPGSTRTLPSSKDAALIALVHKLTGNDIQLVVSPASDPTPAR